ncbi:hypothetical protein HHH56_15375 [Flammeovirga yaeyamensis]|nr:hypothetical protein [Flammeovirga yaeyamensis]
MLFYLVAGINHFIHPQFYIPLIPPYFPYPDLINLISGAVEILLALGVLFSSTRKRAVQGIILMLIAFIPSHVYFIEIGACVGLQSLCTPIWVAWVRLLLIHPLLIVWAWSVR